MRSCFLVSALVVVGPVLAAPLSLHSCVPLMCQMELDLMLSYLSRGATWYTELAEALAVRLKPEVLGDAIESLKLEAAMGRGHSHQVTSDEWDLLHRAALNGNPKAIKALNAVFNSGRFPSLRGDDESLKAIHEAYAAVGFGNSPFRVSKVELLIRKMDGIPMQQKVLMMTAISVTTGGVIGSGVILREIFKTRENSPLP